jgi:hypothetical protein
MLLVVFPLDICIFGLEGFVHAESCQYQVLAGYKKRTYQTYGQ